MWYKVKHVRLTRTYLCGDRSWYLKAAEGNYAAGQNNVGRCYHKGIGTAMHVEQAVAWYQKALESSDRVMSTPIIDTKEVTQVNLGHCPRRIQPCVESPTSHSGSTSPIAVPHLYHTATSHGSPCPIGYCIELVLKHRASGPQVALAMPTLTEKTKKNVDAMLSKLTPVVP
eukprot:1469517-Pyramimonas_sp.AAC.1